MSNDITLITTISFILVLSPFFASITRLPTTPIEIVLGSLAAYVGLIHHSNDFKLIAEVGFLYLMFLAGLEVDLRKLVKTPKDMLKKGFIYLGILYLLSILATIFMNIGNVFLVILPLISIGLLAALSKEYGKEQVWLQYGITIGVLGEIVSIIILTVLSAVITFGVGIRFYQTLLWLVSFFLLAYILYKTLRVLFWWYPEIKTYLMPLKDKKEQDIRISFFIFFVTIALTLFLHLEVAFGAFIAGIFIASFFEHKKELPEKLESFGFGFLIPIFFIYVGSSFDINALSMQNLITKTMLITSLMIGFRLVASLIFIKDLGLKNCMLFGLSHSMPLTLIIAVSTLAYQSNSIDLLHYYSFILASLIEVILSMLIIKVSLRFSQTIHNVNK